MKTSSQRKQTRPIRPKLSISITFENCGKHNVSALNYINERKIANIQWYGNTDG